MKKITVKKTLVFIIGLMLLSVFVVGLLFVQNVREQSLTLAPMEQVIVVGGIVVFLLFGLLIIGMPLIIGGSLLSGLIGLADVNSSSDKKTERKPIIYQVPSNHVWVLRTSYGSDPGNPLYSEYDNPNATEEQKEEFEYPKNYFPQREGYNFWIPYLLVDEGVYSLDPKQRDCEKVVVSSQDKLEIIVDLQITTKIENAVRFAISMEGETVEEKEDFRIKTENALLHTATNQACRRYAGEELQALLCRIGKDENSEEVRRRYWSVLRKCYDTGSEIIDGKKVDYLLPNKDNDQEKVYLDCDISVLWDLAIKNKKFQLQKEVTSDNGKRKTYRYYFEAQIPLGDEIKTELKHLLILPQYGIRVGQIGVQNTLTPNDIQAALQREKAAKIELRTASDEADAIKTMIDKTGANPTVTMVAQMFADAFRGRSGKNPIQSGKKSKN